MRVAVHTEETSFSLAPLLEALELPPDILEACARRAEAQGIPLERALWEAGRLEEKEYLSISGARYGMETAPSLETSETGGTAGRHIEENLICRLPLPWLRRHAVAPLRGAGGELLLAVSRPTSWLLARDVGMVLGEMPVRPVLAAEAAILVLVNRAFGEAARTDGSVADVLGESVMEPEENDEDNSVEDLLEESSEAPFIRLVNMIIAQAVRVGASDIHIEPYRDVSLVRFRLDGVLYERHTLSKAHHAAVVSRIKVMARLDIAEKRLPQDGRIAITLGGRQAGLRVSTLPTTFGERVVLRLLEKNERVLSLPELGLGQADLALMRSLVTCTHGIVLVTGPTGSGKTTTLYAVLQEIAAPDKNILTIEDPVEYELAGVGQMQVNPKVGLSFADGLRSIVRQDPDVILIGEIRDAETASIAVQSALTGHLVFSTLHTNDAPGAVTRLFDMGVEPFLLASVLRAVVAQRLVRVVCPHCREAYTPDARVLEELGDAGTAYREGIPLYRATGCPECMGTGYRGRRAIYEIMPVNSALKRLMVARADADALRGKALTDGMRHLRHDGMLKVVSGMTSITEVARVTNG